MKTIGIIGGMSYESSTHYYERINKQVNELLGGLHAAKIIMYSVDFGEIEPLMRANQWHEIENRLVDIARKLELIGADVIVISSNTIHKVFDAVQKSIQVPMLHIADTVAQECKKKKIKKVGLLGTAYTMQQSFLIERLESCGLEVVVPKEQKDIQEVNRIIFEELCKGIVKDSAKEYYKRVIHKLLTKYGIEGIILGCTEIEMLISKEDVTVPVLDTTNAHINAIVDYILKKG